MAGRITAQASAATGIPAGLPVVVTANDKAVEALGACSLEGRTALVSLGTYIAGSLGQKLAKRKILAFIYLGRAVAISVFLLVPISPLTVYVFASVMGLLWLSTVPPTNATVAQIFGIAHLSMLGGAVFFSHQIGSFMGVWLGGVLYDRTGSYDIVWYIAIALGIFAALINLPVRENAILRAPAGAAA